MRTIEHAGRTIKVKVEKCPADLTPSGFLIPERVMVMIHVKTPGGDFSFGLPPDKATDFANMVKCAVDEQFVKKIMNEWTGFEL